MNRFVEPGPCHRWALAAGKVPYWVAHRFTHRSAQALNSHQDCGSRLDERQSMALSAHKRRALHREKALALGAADPLPFSFVWRQFLFYVAAAAI